MIRVGTQLLLQENGKLTDCYARGRPFTQDGVEVVMVSLRTIPVPVTSVQECDPIVLDREVFNSLGILD